MEQHPGWTLFTRPSHRSRLLLGLTLLGLGCGKDAPMRPEPTFSGLTLSVLGAVEAAHPIDLKIEAVGSDGSRPYTPFSGPVTLTADRGSVTPAEVTLTDGEALIVIRLSAADGAVSLTAASGPVTGRATLQLTPLVVLPGNPSDPVETAIPDLAFEPRGDDYDTNHPDLPGIPISWNTMGIVFKLGATVGEANAILSGLGAVIAGGIPGVLGQAPGVLMVRTAAAGHADMTGQLEQLRADPLIQAASEDWGTSPDELPGLPGDHPGDWGWDVVPGGGNWGLELARVPVVWNLNPSIRRSLFSPVRMGVIDAGLSAHSDLPGVAWVGPTRADDHGTHVAGILGAVYDNGLGVDGVNPFGDLVTAAEDTLTFLWELSSLIKIMNAAPETKVVNVSIGINWAKAKVDPGSRPADQKRLSVLGALCEATMLSLRVRGKAPLICVSAGNDSDAGMGPIDAVYNSGWANAALEHLVPEILVVENVKRDAASPAGVTRAASSNIGGSLAAPGTGILSTIAGGYGLKSGTSMATPFVSGLIGFLYALEPTLTQDEVTHLLSDTAVPVGAGAADRVDAAAAVLDLDALRGSDTILRRFVDIDDGTPDGNQRVVFGSPQTDFVDEDADGDLGPGDGRIDMSDFRRWRDWLLQVEGLPGLKLDGSAQHPKRDLNGNGEVESAAGENIYPRADFNCDGILSRTATSLMPGALGDVEATDLEVLQSLFDDPDVDAADLPGLIESGDIHVSLDSFLGRPGVVSARVQILDGITEVPITERTVTPGSPTVVITVATGLSLYAVKVEGRDGASTVVCTAEMEFTLAPGEDVYDAPECTGVEVQAQMAQYIEEGTPSPLLVRAGIQTGGTVVYQAGIGISVTATGAGVLPDAGLTDGSGNFTAQVTLDPGVQQTTVFVTATDPATGQSATTSVSATALAPPAAARFLGSLLYVSAAARAEENDTGGLVTYEEDVLTFSEREDASTAWVCSGDAGTHMEASGSAALDFTGIEDAVTGYLRSFEFTGTTQAALTAAGSSCGAYSGSAGAGTRTEVRFEMLSGRGFMDLHAQMDFIGEYSYRIEVFESDTLGNSSAVVQDLFSTIEPGGGSYDRTIELHGGNTYFLKVEDGTAAGTQQGNSADVVSGTNATFQILLRGEAPPLR